jgi:hypothetical protein
MRTPCRPLVVLALLVPLAGCAGGGGGGRAGGGTQKETARTPEAPRAVPTTRVGDDRSVNLGALTAADQDEMQRAWRMFVEEDPRWPRARDGWIAKGPAARTILAENLFRYFWSASKVMKKDGVMRVGHEAALVPQEAIVLWGDLLALDKWPLHEATTARVFDPDNATRPGTVTVTHLSIDDVTRQYAALVMALIGPPAVPMLSRPEILAAPRPSSRTYALYALGTIGDDAAIGVLAGQLTGAGDWKDRGAAAKALGFALLKNESARGPLERSAEDPDGFVRKKVEDALSGKSRWEM